MCKKCLKMRLLFAAGGFIIGAAAGAGTAVLICRKKMKEQEEEINNLLEEVNALDDVKVYESNGIHKESYESSKDAYIGASIAAGLRSGIMPVDDARDALNAEMEQVILREGYGRVVPGQKPTLEELRTMPEEELEENEGEAVEGQISIEDYENGEEGEEPHEITAEEFLEDSTFDKDQLTFYTDDETLCDSDDDVLDIDSYLGYTPFMEVVAKAMHGRNKTHLIYWRNPDISCDFEIEIHSGSYTQTVLGADDTERGGYQRTSKRKMKDEDDD